MNENAIVKVDDGLNVHHEWRTVFEVKMCHLYYYLDSVEMRIERVDGGDDCLVLAMGQLP
jgi:hypothetical protein